MKRSWIWIALLLSLGINIGILATIGVGRWRAEKRWEHVREDPQRPPPFTRLADHLKLEGEQRDRFLEIQKQLFESTRQRRQQLEEVREQLRLAVMTDPPDTIRTEELLRESAHISGELERAMVENLLATRKILDPEQQSEYFRVLDRMRQASRPMGSRDRRPSTRRPHEP